MRRLPPLNALRAFEAAGRHKSISQAASELHVSHSAVSQQVKNLETYFGQALFLRDGNKIALTDDAALLLSGVSFCFDHLAHACSRVVSSSRSSSIRVNTTPSVAMRWLIPRLAGFQRDHPGVEVHVETSITDEPPGPASDFDLTIRRRPMRQTGKRCTRLLDDVSSVVMAPKLAEKLQLHTPSDLLSAPLLHMKSRANAWAQWFAAATIPVEQNLPGQTHDHFFLSLEAAINGGGIALAPLSLVNRDVEEGRLVVMFSDIVLTGAGVYGLHDDEGQRLRPVQLLVNWLTEESQN